MPATLSEGIHDKLSALEQAVRKEFVCSNGNGSFRRAWKALYNMGWAWILSGGDANERHVSMDWGMRRGVGRILLDLSVF